MPDSKRNPESAGDRAYALYKAGMRAYAAIRPDVPDLELLFAISYECFRAVATEHADSPWAADARDKLAALERRSREYGRIAAGAGAWRRAGRERGREIEEIVRRTKEMIEGEGGLKWPEE